MAKSIRATIQLVSEEEANAICRIDSQALSSNPQRYAKDNLLGYYVIINTWLLLIQQWSRWGWRYVREYMLKVGLLPVIAEFSDASSQFLSQVEISSGLVRSILADVMDSTSFEGIPHSPVANFHSVKEAAFLLLCRYPKRFSPLAADKLRDSSIQGFVSLQKDMKYTQRSELPRWLVSAVREEFNTLSNWNEVLKRLRESDITDIVFTPGVSFDTGAPLVSKLSRLLERGVEYFPAPFGIPLVSHHDSGDQDYWGPRQYEVHCVRLAAVPKNYKTARIIAPEDVLRQAYARLYFNILDDMSPSEIDLHDQGVNQVLAYEGSLTGSLATIDLAHASDSISWTLLREILPESLLRVIEAVLPTHYLVPKEDKPRLLQSAATMGNSLTFILETEIFLSIAKAAIKYYEVLSDSPVKDPRVAVYGDDIIVPTEASETLIDFLGILGFTVNTDKSYFDPDWRYRESCGEEYLDGICVSSLYFPRFPIEGGFSAFSKKAHWDGFSNTYVTTLSSLVDLQHKLFMVCQPAAILVSELVLEDEPRMTTSTPDEGLQDLYSYNSLGKTFYAPAGKYYPAKYDERYPWRLVVPRKYERVVVEDQTRIGHLAPITQYRSISNGLVSGATPEEQLLVDLYFYQQFLKHGPRYETELDRLLRISSPPNKAGSFAGGNIIWAYIK